jgi:tetratricopeptide (TPR) repeat protein
LKVSKDDEINALVYYELGKIYLLVDDNKNALDSFNSALNFSPSFDIEFECRFESALLLKKLGKIDESAKIFETMRYQGKFKDKLDRILIELGQIYYEKKQADKALIIFKDVDTTYRQTQSGGIAGMKIAKIYEKEYRDYDSSYKYYNKVSVSNVPKDIKTETDRHLKTITNYFALKSQQKEYNQQITYHNKPQYFYQDSVDYSLVFRQYQDRITKMTDSLKISDSQKGLLAQNYTFDQVGKIYIQQQDDLKRNRSGSQKIIDPQIYLVARGIYKKPQKLKMSVDSLQIMISQNLYNLGDLFYSELDAPDSAFVYFKKILKDYPNKPVTSQTMFALGIYYETNRDSVKADSMFKYVYNNFEKDPIRIEAGRKLGLIKKEDENFSIKNRDTVEKAYTEAEQLAYDKKYLESINSFQKIYKNSPKSKYAAKSIYYCGLIYEENLKMYDSAAVEYGLLQSKEYLNSAPAKAVSAKYLVYKTEKEKLKAESDKIKKEAAQKDALNQQKVNPESQKSVPDVNQKPGANIQTEPLQNKGKEIKQSVVKDSPVKLDSLKMLNQKAPLSNPKSVPDKLKMEKDTTKKFIDPL